MIIRGRGRSTKVRLKFWNGVVCVVLMSTWAPRWHHCSFRTEGLGTVWTVHHGFPVCTLGPRSGYLGRWPGSPATNTLGPSSQQCLMLGVKGHRRVIVRTWHGGQLSLPVSFKTAGSGSATGKQFSCSNRLRGWKGTGFLRWPFPSFNFTRGRVQQRCFSDQTRAHMPFFWPELNEYLLLQFFLFF